MKLSWKIVWFVGCVFGSVRAAGAPMNTAPELEYSQDGITFQPFDVLVGRAKVRNYYNYYGLSGHPAFGTKRDTATTALYWDSKRHALSMIVINGMARHGFRTAVGEAHYAFSGLTSATYLSVRDDPDDIHHKKGRKTASADFQYKSSTDGLVFSGLEQRTFKIRVALTDARDLDTWRLADGTPGGGGGGFLALDATEPLFVRMAALPGVGATTPPGGGSGGSDPAGGTVGGGTVGTPPVPEPAAAIPAAAAFALLAAGRRRR